MEVKQKGSSPKGSDKEIFKNVPSIEKLVEAGAHFGHLTYKWNPKMRTYIYGVSHGSHIIDMAKTVGQIGRALRFVRKIVRQKQSILFVGTSKHAKVAVQEGAEACEESFITHRWLGGMLTNFHTICQSINKLKSIESKIELDRKKIKKKELVLLEKQAEKLNNVFCGIRDMSNLPGLLVVVNPSHDKIAIEEANRLSIPIIALTDTNCNPDPIDYVIACNDDARNSIQLIIDTITSEIIQEKEKLVSEKEIDSKKELSHSKKNEG